MDHARQPHTRALIQAPAPPAPATLQPGDLSQRMPWGAAGDVPPAPDDLGAFQLWDDPDAPPAAPDDWESD